MTIEKAILSATEPKETNTAWVQPKGDSLQLNIFNNGKWRPVGGGSSENNFNYYTIKEDTTYEDLKSLYDSSSNDSIKVFSNEHGLGTLTYKHLSGAGIEQNVFSILYENGNAEFFGFDGNEYFHSILLSRQRYMFISDGSITYNGNIGQGSISRIIDMFTREIVDLYTIHGKTSVLMSSDGKFFYLTWSMPLDTNMSEFESGTTISTWMGSTGSNLLIYSIKKTQDSGGGGNLS